MPLAFFCTLFFRHRKKSVSAPWDDKSQSAPESARHSPPGQGFAPAGALGAFRSPPVPFGSPPEAIERSIGLQALSPRRSRRVIPHRGNFLRQSCRLSMQAGGLSSGQTIGAVRTAVRSACCLPELRVANRLRRLYPLDTRFPSFPFGNLRPRRLAKFSHGAASPATRVAVGASSPRREPFYSKAGFCHRLPK